MLKQLLSYITDIHLESRDSDHSGELHVLLSRGRHQLCTENAIYSYDDLYDNFRRAFSKIKIEDRPIRDVLILGLGLGSIPSMLENKFDLLLSYTAVEIDEEVIDLANNYVLTNLASNIETITADAHGFIMQNDKQYDMICMDVFIDDVIPERFTSCEFLMKLKQTLTQDGILLYNRLARTKNDLNETKTFYQDHFLPVFEEGGFIDVKGNWMLTNRKLV